MNVIDFSAKKQERSPHWAGRVICMSCRHEWEGVGEIGVHTGLECPECHTPKGITKHLFAGSEGDLEFRCACGCEALTAYYRQGAFRMKCMACGNDQTSALYG